MKLEENAKYAIAAISVIEIIALLLGHNGLLISLAIASISGLGGFTLGVDVMRKTITKGMFRAK